MYPDEFGQENDCEIEIEDKYCSVEFVLKRLEILHRLPPMNQNFKIVLKLKITGCIKKK